MIDSEDELGPCGAFLLCVLVTTVASFVLTGAFVCYVFGVS